MRKAFFCLLSILLLVQPALAQDIPSMQKYVNDYANILSPIEEAELNSLAQTIEENTSVEIGILTVRTTGDMSIEEFGVEVFEKNGIGKKDTDNGLLIVVAVDDREWRFEVGYGLEPILNDAKVGLIGRTFLTPEFREERYGAGLYNAVLAIDQGIQNSGDVSFISEQSADDYEIFIIVMILIFIMVPIILSIAFLYQKCPNCGTRMKCYEKGDFVICECPKCKKIIQKKRKRRFFWLFLGGSGRSSGGFSGGSFGGGSSGGGGASGGW